VLERDGLYRLSLRAVATHLGVRVNAVAWHVKDKAGLLAAVADAIMATSLPTLLPPDPQEQVRRLLHALRAALRSHRDGARLARTGFSPSRPHHLAFAEAFNTALRATGRTPKETAWTDWTLMYFVLGLVIEEQTPPEALPSIQAAASDPGAYPSLATTIKHLSSKNYDDRFAYGIDLILTGRSATPQ